MEDHNKMDRQADRKNRDQETDKKPTQGSDEGNRQPQRPERNIQQGQQNQREKQDREKKSA